MSQDNVLAAVEPESDTIRPVHAQVFDVTPDDGCPAINFDAPDVTAEDDGAFY